MRSHKGIPLSRTTIRKSAQKKKRNANRHNLHLKQLSITSSATIRNKKTRKASKGYLYVANYRMINCEAYSILIKKISSTP